MVATLVLSVNDRCVFEFEVDIHTHFGEFDVYRSESFGDTKSFIEGAWTEELDPLMSAILEHEKTVREFRQKQRREDPKVIADLKKRFGL